MGSYLLAIGFLVLMGYGIQISRWKNLGGHLLTAKGIYRLSIEPVFWFAIFLTLLLFGGLRYYVGTDFESYYTIFRDICEDWDDLRYQGTEAGFVWLNRWISLFTDNPQWIIFIANGIISFFCTAALIKESKFVPFSIYIIFTTIYYQSFNLVRQGMACSIVLLAFVYAKERKWLRCYGLILFAALFHRTALIMLPIMFLMQFQYVHALYFVFFALASLGIFLQDQITALLLRIYPSAMAATDAYLYEESSPLQIAMCLIYAVLCLLYYRKLLDKDKGNVLYVNFSVLLLGLYAFFYWIPMWGRIQLYFIGFYSLIVPEVISCEESRMMRILYYAVIWGILLFFFIVPNLNSSGLWPYQTIFSQ